MRILLIEDDIKLKEYISEYLQAYDYHVTTINDFDILSLLLDIYYVIKKYGIIFV
ncbi:response regulator transcription factor [Clostridium frigidicarnis]|uniref:Stage 0 sporulation protein A homolog n=1 Tax=Clostridium frigidicarnis TaxID=84698 RepID=A0A1I1A681_9CLOT|nr:response regulator transcription factor [Clostridium frigidicarnis]SFB33471.1 hypothetical protein SAMN04488528_103039 [Clostridium frigidicarnis]